MKLSTLLLYLGLVKTFLFFYRSVLQDFLVILFFTVLVSDSLIFPLPVPRTRYPVRDTHLVHGIPIP